MKKKNRRFFLSLALVLMMLVNLFPLGIVHAGGTGDKTLVLTDLVAAVSQGGTAIAPGGTLTSTEPITIEISFGVPVEGDDPTPADPVRKGDYAILNLSEAFSLASGSNIELKTGDDTLVGHVDITRDGDTGMVVAQVTFDGEDSVFDGTSNTVSCGFTANFEYDDSGEAGNPGDYEVIILEKTYMVNVPPLEIIYEVTKSGSADLANKQITWEVLLAATQGGEPIDLAGYIFSDDLAAVGAYVDGSFTVGGTAETPTKDGSKISYVFPDNYTSPQTITFKTEISDDAYYAASQQNVTNKAQLLDSEEEFLKEGEITVTFTPQWIAKTGLSSDSGSSGDYDPKNRTITWTIIANQMEAALQNVVITDVMPGGLEFGSAYWEKWDSNEEKWIDKNEFAAYPAEGKYELGDI
ncbi:MAG: hypothetical protein GX878_05160, partial [Firmicutes bacterium]|nr:hypothetical protein [Bacillota bacterium]